MSTCLAFLFDVDSGDVDRRADGVSSVKSLLSLPLRLFFRLPLFRLGLLDTCFRGIFPLLALFRLLVCVFRRLRDLLLCLSLRTGGESDPDRNLPSEDDDLLFRAIPSFPNSPLRALTKLLHVRQQAS